MFFTPAPTSLSKTVVEGLAVLKLRLTLANRASVPTQKPLGKALAATAQQVHHTAHELPPLTALEQRRGIFPKDDFLYIRFFRAFTMRRILAFAHPKQIRVFLMIIFSAALISISDKVNLLVSASISSLRRSIHAEPIFNLEHAAQLPHPGFWAERFPENERLQRLAKAVSSLTALTKDERLERMID